MCSKCFTSKEAMAGKALAGNIKGFTETAKRDPYLLHEAQPVNIGGWMKLGAIVVIIVAVFGKPVASMFGGA